MKFINKKSIYLLALFIICLLTVVIVPTYAKFASNYVTDNDVVSFSLDFSVNITNIEEYEQFTVPAGETYKFNVKLTNGSATDVIYYGIWYRMVKPSEKTNDILIGRSKGTEVTTSGSIEALSDTTATIAIMNNSSEDITLDIGVASSTTNTTDIEYLGGRYLVKGEVEIIDPKDIMISSIKIDNIASDSLPTSGVYDMTYTCSKGSQLEWDTITKSITYKSGSYIKDNCSLEFTTSTNYKYLNEMPVGSYVAYVGEGGLVGDTEVKCSKDVNADTDSCYGRNANEVYDTSNYTYGYCDDDGSKYYTTGWRIAYVDSNTNKVALISAGSSECYEFQDNMDIETMNTLSLKYCNEEFVNGNCTCVDENEDGLCDSPSLDAWVINDYDFYNITKAISGFGKRLTYSSSSLGDSGGSLGEQKYCVKAHSYRECGYNNDLLDNGGFYWYGYIESMDDFGPGIAENFYWDPDDRGVSRNTFANAYGLRPVISLSSSVFVTGGKGTMDSPYTIDN